MIPSGKKFWSSTVLASAALAALVAASLLRRPTDIAAPALPAAVSEAVVHEALEWRATASLVVAASNTQFAWLDSEEAVQDEARLIEVCDNLASASAAMVEDFRRRAAVAARVGKGVDQVEVERFFRQTLREVLPRCPESGAGQGDVIFQLPAAPLHSFILSAPALAPPNPVLQRILERLLQVLTRLLQFLPPGSPAVASVQRAIDAILALLGTADTTPPLIQSFLPANGSLTNDSTPTISGTVTDSGGSGVDANSLVVLLDGVAVAASRTVVDSNRVDFTFTPATSISDGSHTVAVAAKDASGNTAANATTSFTVDATNPSIELSSPTSGSTVPSELTPIQGVLRDSLSGVQAGGLSVSLNGAAVTSSLQTTPGASTPFGGFAVITISGTLTAIPGDNLLAISLLDVAGNAAQTLIAFTVDSVTEPPPVPLVLTIVSGNSQSGLVGRGADEDLVVRVTDGETGIPVPGAYVTFSGKENGGSFSRSRKRSVISDGGGLAGVRYVYSSKPGVNLIEASIAAEENVIPAIFSLEGKLPSLSDQTVRGPFNCHYRTDEYPGSALGRIFKARATKPDGSPLKGEVIRPFVAEFNGAPPSRSIGRFLPARAIADSNGEAKFAFVIDRDAPIGSFTLQFGLPDFRDAQDNEVRFDVGGAVLDPSTRPQPVTEINYDDPESSGQAQIGIGGRRLALPLRARGHNAVLFFQIEGSGSYEPGTEGTLWAVDVDPMCGPYAQVNVDQSGLANVRFTPANNEIVLIAVSGVTDIFAIGPPEIEFVSENASGQLVHVPNVWPTRTTLAESQHSFRVLAKVPKGASAVVRVDGLNSLGEELTSINHAVAGSTLDSTQLGLSPAQSKPTYDTYVSKPLVSTDQLLVPGETASPGVGAFTFVQGTGLGGLTATLSVQGQERAKARAMEASLRVRLAGAGKRLLLFYKRPPFDGLPDSVIEFSFALGDGKTLKSVEWNLDGNVIKRGTDGASIHAKFIDGDSQTDGPTGTADDPYSIKVAENNDNRRKNLPISAKIVYVEKVEGVEKEKPLELKGVARLALNKADIGTGIPPKTQAGLDSVMNWKTTPPVANFVFTDPNDATNPMSDANRRALARLTDELNKPIDLKINPLAFFKQINPFGGTATTIGKLTPYLVYGTVVPVRAFDWDRECIELFVDHEAKHVIYKADASAGRATLFKDLGDAVAMKPAGARYTGNFEHAVIILADLKDNRASYRMILDTSPGKGQAGDVFVQCFNATLKNLVENQPYTFGQQPIPGAGLPDALVERLKSDPVEGVRAIYKSAIEAFPELEEREEFFDLLQLVRPQ